MTVALESAAAEVGPDGVLWVYFAGHGGGDPTTGERLLVGDTAKRDAASFASASLSEGALQELVAGVAGEVVVIDACFNGLGRDGEEYVDQRFAIPDYSAAPVARVTTWAAAGPEELGQPAALRRARRLHLLRHRRPARLGRRRGG